MFTADRIDDRGIWLGDLAASENVAALDEHRITHVLTILDYRPAPLDERRMYFYIHADDLQSTDLLTREFDRAFHFLDQGHEVLIHCQAGMSRSATIAAMYLMRKYSLTRDQALERLREKRRHSPVMPNDGFLRQLDLFHRMEYKVDQQNDLYREFQQHRCDLTKTSEPTIVLIGTDSTDRDYRCRSCQKTLFNSSDVQRHERRESNVLCEDPSMVFTFFLDWIEEIFDHPFDSIRCPTCQTIVGEYSLQGLRCSCQQWIKPAFVFQCHSIE
jgi:dual specificity phosphatase 12